INDLDQTILRRAYYAVSKAAHPDKGGSKEEFAELAQAYKILVEELLILENLRKRHEKNPCMRFSSVSSCLWAYFSGGTLSWGDVRRSCEE
ncbi:unnamed protein product, partial [Amoebophrya sp. A25]